ncbi:hypothetical protein SAMN02910455_00730 [Acidaminococcus fermentans]|uniref:hypothetical protein n=1 Tax=Acidaminococcus fermentans TaxID=905 RepID=UPI0008EBE3CF|nr:hypothetical protein [uncultured Acidaminococcus sp.]SFO50394.1 hypothetical protein SAMN02910455_00730 [Acidaminococcus fermentans]
MKIAENHVGTKFHKYADIDKEVITVKKHRTLASWLLIIFQTVFGIIVGAPWFILGLLMVDAFIIFMSGALNIVSFDSIVTFVKISNVCAFAAMVCYAYYLAKNDN